MKLNAKSLEAEVKRSTRPCRISLGDGLNLKLGVRGESWVFRYQLNGRRRDRGLGKYPAVSLKDAREKLVEARGLLNRGIDPVDAAHSLIAQDKASREESKHTGKTFQQLAELYIDQHSAGWRNTKHKQQWANTLRDYAYPYIGDSLVAEIDTEQILHILMPIWHTKNETANRVRGRIESVIDMARALDYRSDHNPAVWRGHLSTLLPSPNKVQKRNHHASMPHKDIPRFWKSLDECQGARVEALRFLILTACRTGEVRFAEWSEIDLDERVWAISGERMKSGNPHVVPLSNEAMMLLKQQVGVHNKWVFPSRKGQRLVKNALSNMAMASLLRQIAPDYTVHGFRSSFRVWGAEETNYPSAVMEMALAHVMSNATEAAYQRSDLLDKRRTLMNDWGNFVTGGAKIERP
jgi:integrase